MRKVSATACLLILITLMLPASVVYGQKKKDKDKQFTGTPEKILKQADYLYATYHYVDAEEGYKEVLKKDPKNFHATYRAGMCNWITHEYADAINYFESAIELNPNANDTLYFNLGIAYKKMNRYNDAKETFNTFKKRWKYQDDYAKQVKQELAGCDFAIKELEKEQKWLIKEASFNSGSGDYLPSVLNQEKQDSFLVFTSHRPFGKNAKVYQGYNESAYSDVWMVKMEDDSTFGPPIHVEKPISTPKNDGSTSFTPDGQTMYFSICNEGKNGYGCSIYLSNWDANKKQWQKPVLVEGVNGKTSVVINSRGKTKEVPTYDVQPSISGDGNVLVFVSKRGGGQGLEDVWYCTKSNTGWSEPKNAGSVINTPFQEISPYLSRDGKKLYFASNGHIGFGGFDMYVATGEVGKWSNPVNLSCPINTSYDDFGAIFFRHDSSVIFTSNRPEGTGGYDIYTGKLKEAPPITIALHGTVRDKNSLAPIPFATVVLFQIDNDGQLEPVDTFKTDNTGRYNFADLEKDASYKVIGNAPEYLANEETFDTKNIKENTDLEKNIDIKLDRIFLFEPIVINNIYYDFDKSDLRPESITELDRLFDILTKNPHITIELGSHTDTNGSEEYNKKLSERRAQSVLEYLIGKGVVKERLSWFGYGESQPLVYPEMSDEDEQLNRRTQFRILSIEFSGAGN